MRFFVKIAPKIVQGEKPGRCLAVLSNNYMARWKPMNPADPVTSIAILLGLLSVKFDPVDSGSLEADVGRFEEAALIRKPVHRSRDLDEFVPRHNCRFLIKTAAPI